MQPEAYDLHAEVEGRHWWFRARRRVVATLLEGAHLAPGCQIVELGSGTGGNLPMLARFGDVWAVEPDARAREAAERRAPAAHHAASMSDLADAIVFDAAVVLDVIEHLDDPAATLRELSARLCPGAPVVVTVPAHPWLFGAHDEFLHHRRRYTAALLRQHLEAGNLEVERVGAFHAAALAPAASHALLERVGRAARRGRQPAPRGMGVPPRPLNELLAAVSSLDRFAAARGGMPFGLSLFAVARARRASSSVQAASPTPCPREPATSVDVSVVVPAFDEGQRLGRTLAAALDHLALRHPRFELVVVDDGSRDDTVALAREFVAREPRVRLIELGVNRGKGAAVRAGVLAARGRRVLFMDADLSTPMGELDKLMAALDAGADVAIGSRGVEASRIRRRQGRARERMGRTFNAIVRAVVLGGVRDTQCGFKLFTGAAARAVFERTTVDRFAFDVEVLLVARDLGFRIDEVGVEWSHDPQSRVSPITDATRMLLDVVALRLRRRRAARP